MRTENQTIKVDVPDDACELEEFTVHIETKLAKERYGEDADGNRGIDIWVATSHKITEIEPEPPKELYDFIVESALAKLS